jgi:ribosomal protein S12 methylthiotransferase
MDRLLEFIGSVEFDMVGVFAYSPQADTPAAELPGRVPDGVKQERLMDVVSFQHEISHRKMEARLGSELIVLVDERDGPDCLGHSQYDMAGIDRTIRIAGCRLRPGKFATVRLETVSAPFEWTASPA